MQTQNSSVVNVDGAGFDSEVLAEPGLVLLDVSTSWCPPCRMMAPIVEQIAVEFVGQVKVCALDLEQELELGRKLNISVVPTFLVYRGGELVERFTGALSKKALVEKLGLK